MSANPTPRPYDCPKCGQVHDRCLGHPRKRPGVPCRQQPLNGQDVCKNHGGKSPQALAKAADRIEAEALRNEANRLGIPRDVDPGTALLGLVHEAAGNVEFYRLLVAALPVHPGADTRNIGDDGELYYDRGDPGIYGRTYHVSGIPTGEAKPNILIVLYNDERDRLANYVKTALTLGLEERRVRMVESDARTIFGAVGKACEKAKLTPAQAEEFRRELADQFRSAERSRLAG